MVDIANIISAAEKLVRNVVVAKETEESKTQEGKEEPNTDSIIKTAEDAVTHVSTPTPAPTPASASASIEDIINTATNAIKSIQQIPAPAPAPAPATESIEKIINTATEAIQSIQQNPASSTETVSTDASTEAERTGLRTDNVSSTLTDDNSFPEQHA